jgi:glycosyltransferase involved in cell wall biosynthesis
MKIAFIGQKGIPCRSGGVEKHVEQLAIRLAQRGHDVFAYARKYYSENRPQSFQGVHLIYTPTIKTKHLDAITHTLTSTLHALFQGYDIIHYHAIGPSFLLFIPRLLLGRTKIVSTFHSLDWTNQKWGRFARLCLRFGAWMSVHVPHRTIAVSNLLRDFCQMQYRKEIEYIPNGVPETSECPPRQIARQFNLKKDSYILAVARLIPLKGLHTLIEAFRQIETDKKLVVVGGSAYTDFYVQKLQALAKQDPRVVLAGEQHGEIMKEFFSNAYAFCHPSETEGLSIAVLEAMSYGRGIVASQIPGNIEAAGDAALYFQPGHTAELKQKLEKVLADPRLVSTLGIRAKHRARELYNWDTIVENTEHLYQELLGRAPDLVFVRK